MRAIEFITEGLSKTVFHYTSISSALTIVESGNFALTSAIGSNVELQYAPKGYPYYLSTTRTRRGGYHSNSGRYASTGVLFVLDGEWYGSRYPAKSIDYWQDRSTKNIERSHEAEDRIFSKTSEISIKGVTGIHVFVTDDADQPVLNERARQLLIAAKKQNIPTYFYDNFTDWINFNKKKPGNISKLKGHKDTPAHFSSASVRSYIKPWIELINAKSKSQLSTKAKALVNDLLYDYYRDNEYRRLSNEFDSNRRATSSFEKDRKYVIDIIKFMQQNKIENLKQFVEFIAKKWENIS